MDIATARDTVGLANLLANKVQAYFADGTRSAYIIENTRMTLTHNLKADEKTADLATVDGNIYCENIMDAYITYDGVTYYASLSNEYGRMNTNRLGFYYYDTHIYELIFRSAEGRTLPFKLDKQYHTWSDRLYHRSRLLATRDTSADEFGLETRIPKDTVAGMIVGNDDAYYDNPAAFYAANGEQADIAYAAFDIKNTGVFGFIFPVADDNGMAEITDDGDSYIIRQRQIQPGQSYSHGEGPALGCRVYTDNAHDFGDIIREAYLERHPLTGFSIYQQEDNAQTLGYDPYRGAYVLSLDGSGDFNKPYYEQPDKHYRANFELVGDEYDRNIYVWINTPYGCLECAALLDADGRLLPVPMQVCKNFRGEYEEKFYDPNDPAYGDTFFALKIPAGEKVRYTAVNLYQNWGQFPLKQLSSIQFFISYYHMSCGVTESNCVAPYFVYGKDGWVLPDFRGPSGTMWGGQPQFNSVGRLYFYEHNLTGRTRDRVQSEYNGSFIRSSGPVYLDFDYKYTSDDGKVDYTLRHLEMPHTDENRSYYTLDLTFNDTVTFDEARAQLQLFAFDGRFVSFKKLAYLGRDGGRVTAQQDLTQPYEEYIPLAADSPYFGYYDFDEYTKDPSNGMNFGLLIKDYSISIGGRQSDVTLALKNAYDGSLNRGTLTLDADQITFNAGDSIHIDMILLPWGKPSETDDVSVQKVYADSIQNPLTTAAAVGSVVADSWLPTVEAKNGTAEFTVSGGYNNCVVRVNGLPGAGRPEIYEYINGEWTEYTVNTHAYDGYQIYAADNGCDVAFAFISDGGARTFRVVSAGE